MRREESGNEGLLVLACVGRSSIRREYYYGCVLEGGDRSFGRSPIHSSGVQIRHIDRLCVYFAWNRAAAYFRAFAGGRNGILLDGMELVKPLLSSVYCFRRRLDGRPGPSSTQDGAYEQDWRGIGQAAGIVLPLFKAVERLWHFQHPGAFDYAFPDGCQTLT